MNYEKEIEQIKKRLAQWEKTITELTKAVKWCAIAILVLSIACFVTR